MFKRFPRAAVVATSAVLLACLGIGAGLGSAASLGTVTSALLNALSVTGLTKPFTLSDNFAGNGNLNGRIATTGQTWVVNSGTWNTTSSTARTGNTAGIAYIATVPWLNIPSRVQVTVQTSAQTTGMGLMMHTSTSGTTGTVVRVSRTGALQLGRLTAGVWSTLASTTVTANGTYALEYNSGVYTVLRNGVSVLTYNVPLIDQPVYEANTRVGMYSADRDGNARWSAFSAVNL